ncbi:MAG: ATP-binding protein, partial [Rhodospirillales bacterium]|nr:ATP-binding protein [Rhodospirillales bacterium]
RWFVQKNAPNKTPTDINSTIRNAAEFMHNEFIENDIVLDFQLCEGLPRIPVDAIQIQQVVMNLSRNAIEAMRSDNQIPKKLTIGTAAEGSGIEVTVSDTGPGLSPDVEAELFEPFVTDKPEGMGIGLSICRSLVQAHGGRLYAESVPGQGTVFRFTIPHEPVD